MSQKYYKPILKKGDHLVRSKSNPNRVRGLSRDKNNKHQDINEWEEVEIPNNSNNFANTMNDVAMVAEMINQFISVIKQHPEIIKYTISGAKWIFRTTKKVGISAKNSIQGAITKSKSNKLGRLDGATDIISDEQVGAQPKEEMSVEEARKLLLQTLNYYIEIRKNISRLSNAQIENITLPQIEQSQMLEYMDGLLTAYPKLMDADTSSNVMQILRLNSDELENRRICKLLGIAS